MGQKRRITNTNDDLLRVILYNSIQRNKNVNSSIQIQTSPSLKSLCCTYMLTINRLSEKPDLTVMKYSTVSCCNTYTTNE